MNALRAEVEAIKSDEYFNILSLNSNNVRLKLLEMELPKWVEVGDTVECQIKEASISVCKERGKHNVSIENQIDGCVTNILKGDILCELTLDTPCGTIKSLITSDACDRMEVKQDDEVTLLFKAVDIKMQPALPSDALGIKNAFAKTH